MAASLLCLFIFLIQLLFITDTRLFITKYRTFVLFFTSHFRFGPCGGISRKMYDVTNRIPRVANGRVRYKRTTDAWRPCCETGGNIIWELSNSRNLFRRLNPINMMYTLHKNNKLLDCQTILHSLHRPCTCSIQSKCSVDWHPPPRTHRGLANSSAFPFPFEAHFCGMCRPTYL